MPRLETLSIKRRKKMKLIVFENLFTFFEISRIQYSVRYSVLFPYETRVTCEFEVVCYEHHRPLRGLGPGTRSPVSAPLWQACLGHSSWLSNYSCKSISVSWNINRGISCQPVPPEYVPCPLFFLRCHQFFKHAFSKGIQ